MYKHFMTRYDYRIGFKWVGALKIASDLLNLAKLELAKRRIPTVSAALALVVEFTAKNKTVGKK